MAEVDIRIAAQDAASGPLGAVGRSARLMGADFDVADIKIATAIRHLRENGSLASMEWGGFSTAYSAGWTIRTTAAAVGDAALLALEGAQKLRGTTAGTEEAGNTVLRIKNYTDIGIAAATLNGFGSVLHGYSYVRLGQLGTWWGNTRNLIVGIVDNDLGTGMGRLSGGLGGLVVAADTMANRVGASFGRLANSVVSELSRALGARDSFVGGLGVPGVGGLAVAADAGTVVRISSPMSSAMTQIFDGGWRDDPKIFAADVARQQFLGDRFGEPWPTPKYEAPQWYLDTTDIDQGGDQVSMGGGYPSWWHWPLPYTSWQGGAGYVGQGFMPNAKSTDLPMFDPRLDQAYSDHDKRQAYYMERGVPDNLKGPGSLAWGSPKTYPGFFWSDEVEPYGAYIPYDGYFPAEDDPLGPDLGLFMEYPPFPQFPSGPPPPSRQRASGGSVTGGTPYMVGEQGPELFVGSGGGGRDLNVRTLNLYGVQDGAALFDVVMREARSRGVGIG